MWPAQSCNRLGLPVSKRLMKALAEGIEHLGFAPPGCQIIFQYSPRPRPVFAGSPIRRRRAPASSAPFKSGRPGDKPRCEFVSRFWYCMPASRRERGSANCEKTDRCRVVFYHGPSVPKAMTLLVQEGLLAERTLRRVRAALFRTVPLGPVNRLPSYHLSPFERCMPPCPNLYAAATPGL